MAWTGCNALQLKKVGFAYQRHLKDLTPNIVSAATQIMSGQHEDLKCCMAHGAKNASIKTADSTLKLCERLRNSAVGSACPLNIKIYKPNYFGNAIEGINGMLFQARCGKELGALNVRA
jgi:hypothetical protein